MQEDQQKKMERQQRKMHEMEEEIQQRKEIEKRLKESNKPRLSTQFVTRQGWKDELPQEYKKDRLNKPFYNEKGERRIKEWSS